ncbi:uncharacterized protein LOC133289357 [Gastrolobium bilobum]|uniref:uncharacterized protein LOC133289357 n=1 Tax=Gastrolobium bilobum TaxID=150636 RepID=UPI002AB047CC|nr:uncharacterized protein LOC133289357 [Gastrolobium bilobum]
MTSNTRTLVNAAVGGSLKTEALEEAIELLESLASQEFDNAPNAQRVAGIMKLDGYDAILAQNEQMMQMHNKQQEQLDALTKQFNLSQVSSVSNSQIKCGICAEAHATEDCDYMRTTEKSPAEVNGICYKPNHQLNLLLPLQQQQQPPPQGTTSEWEKAFAQLSKTTSDYIQNEDAFRDEIRASFRNQEASIWNLETQISQLSKQFAERTHGTFPSNTGTNPNAQCNSIVTRSRIVIQPVEKPTVEKKKEEEPVAEKEKENDAEEVEKSCPEKKLFKLEKKKALDRQPKPADPSPYARVPYPQRLKQEIQKQQYTKFLDIFKKLQVNIPFAEALESMSNYAKFMKDLLSKKRKLKECETVALTEECSTIIQKKLPPKLKDPGSFSIPIAIGNIEVRKTLCDLGANFVILNMEEDAETPLLLGRPFLATARAMIDVEQGKLMLRMNEETVPIDVFESMKHLSHGGDYFMIDIIQEAIDDTMKEESSPLELEKINEEVEIADKEPVVEELERKIDDIPLGAPKVELKELPLNLNFAFLGENNTYLVIINNELATGEEEKLLKVLKKHKAAIGWSFSDLKGINPSFCTHKILMEDDIKPEVAA